MGSAQDIGLPVVVKPQYGNHGRGVANQPEYSRRGFGGFMLRLVKKNPLSSLRTLSKVKIYRLLVVGDRMVAAARRVPAQVVGDGKVKQSDN